MMGQIRWNTDINAPCCPGEIVNEDDGQTILIQTDWDYPSTAISFGWSIQNVQNTPAHRAIKWFSEDVDLALIDGIDSPDGFADFARTIYEELSGPCDHSETDGTVDCDECGVTISEFINAARRWLDENDRVVADDPGYFKG